MIANDWHPLRWLATWRALGRLGIVLTIVLSLVRLPDTGIHIDHGDKYEHAFGYLGLMLWYAQLCSTWRALAWRALGLVLLGAAIEVAQSFTTWRSCDWRDFVADVLGVAVGLALARTPAARVFAWVEGRFARRPTG